mmetsp:Transcript_63262/g.196276  ORF Transcript_63262/g.196276 Transcript_63262/m.196276 type:complete len:255 (-) Transcript_63262:23-787(-)
MLRHVRVVLLEERLHSLHARLALGLVELAVPEAAAHALVRVLHVLLLVHALVPLGQQALGLVGFALDEGGVPEVVVVLDAHEIVQEDLPGLLVAVRAVWVPVGLVAMASRHPLEALRGLGAVHVQAHLVGVDLAVLHPHGRARPRQGVPQRRMALVGALLAVPVRLVGPQVRGDVQVLHLAADDEAVLVVHVLADGRRTPAGVVGHEGAELALVRVPELPGVPHSHLVAPDAVDLVLPGRGRDDLVVEVPHHSR